jgi:hypothetical protein
VEEAARVQALEEKEAKEKAEAEEAKAKAEAEVPIAPTDTLPVPILLPWCCAADDSTSTHLSVSVLAGRGG